jgi:hypothetical protein
MATREEFNQWNLEQKKKNRFAGLCFFKKTQQEGDWIIASRHWPHLLCWSWGIHFYGYFQTRRYHPKLGYWSNGMKKHPRKTFSFCIFSFMYTAQKGMASQYAASIYASNHGAPKVDWDAERRNARIDKIGLSVIDGGR